MRLSIVFYLIIIGMALAMIDTVSAQTVVTYRAPESEADHRYNYEQDLIRLALEKTEAEYGEFEMQPSPVMNFARAEEELRSGDIENLILKTSATDEFLEEFEYVSIPVARGVFGYRLFFTTPEISAELEDVQSLDDLRNYTIGQGTGWVDVDILQHNDFEIIEAHNFDSLFRMVSANRFDLFARGTNEILAEYNNYSDQVDNLVLDDNIILYYHLPRILFTSPGNEEIAERLELGIERAFEDGSLLEVWEEYYQESIEFVGMEDRTMFTIDNPFLETFNMDEYSEYMYDPFD